MVRFTWTYLDTRRVAPPTVTHRCVSFVTVRPSRSENRDTVTLRTTPTRNKTLEVQQWWFHCTGKNSCTVKEWVYRLLDQTSLCPFFLPWITYDCRMTHGPSCYGKSTRSVVDLLPALEPIEIILLWLRVIPFGERIPVCFIHRLGPKMWFWKTKLRKWKRVSLSSEYNYKSKHNY